MKIQIALMELRNGLDDKKYRVIGLKNTTEYSIGQRLTKNEVNTILNEKQPEGVEVNVSIKGE